MRCLLALALAPSLVAQPERYLLRGAPPHRVTLEAGLLAERLATNRRVTIPHCFLLCEETKRIANFAVAGRLEQGKHEGYFFNDSDVYKLVEGACLALRATGDAALRKTIDAVVDKIARAQEPDGYLYTARTLQREGHLPPGGKERWSDLQSGHELYCAGHLYEAAITHHDATGSKRLLDVATKHADLVLATFGPGKDQHPDGHPEVELALARLAEATGQKKYLELARFFLDARGRAGGDRKLYGEYAQDHAPVREQKAAVGHAVRAAYLFAGMADVGALGNDPALLRASAALWEDAVAKKLYLTGGIGARAAGEAFGGDYELPNASAYAETCAAIANALWSWRLFLQEGAGPYADVVELCVYNGVLSGLSLSGDRFFYPNPLESRGAERQRWFACACCPPNVVRFLETLPGLCYATGAGTLCTGLYAQGTASVEVDGKPVVLRQRTEYPFDGKVELVLEPEAEQRFALVLRVPGWARGVPAPGGLYRFLDGAAGEVVLTVNGKRQQVAVERGALRVERGWKKGDTVVLDLQMPARRVVAREEVAADRLRTAVMRGPLVYCAEATDQPDGRVLPLVLPSSAELRSARRADLLGGVTAVVGTARVARRELDGTVSAAGERELVMVPYYAWANRTKGEMAVWLAREPAASKPLPAPTLAACARLLASGGTAPEAMVDQLLPSSSIDQDVPNFHWWPKKGTLETVELEFIEAARVSAVEVYWFQDEGKGECRVPAGWKLFARVGGAWRRLCEDQELGCAKDAFNVARFPPLEA